MLSALVHADGNMSACEIRLSVVRIGCGRWNGLLGLPQQVRGVRSGVKYLVKGGDEAAGRPVPLTFFVPASDPALFPEWPPERGDHKNDGNGRYGDLHPSILGFEETFRKWLALRSEDSHLAVEC